MVTDEDLLHERVGEPEEPNAKQWDCPWCHGPMLIPHKWDGTVFCLDCGYDSQSAIFTLDVEG